MITILVSSADVISQKSYEDIVFSLNRKDLICSCGCRGKLIWHGRYKRKVLTANTQVSLFIFRVKCTACGRTHAILPSGLTPGAQVSLTLQHQIIMRYENAMDNEELLESNSLLEKETADSIRYRYKRYWREKIKPFMEEDNKSRPDGVDGVKEDISLTELILGCFSCFHCQFMQRMAIPNVLYKFPT